MSIIISVMTETGQITIVRFDLLDVVFLTLSIVGIYLALNPPHSGQPKEKK